MAILFEFIEKEKATFCFLFQNVRLAGDQQVPLLYLISMLPATRQRLAVFIQQLGGSSYIFSSRSTRNHDVMCAILFSFDSLDVPALKNKTTFHFLATTLDGHCILLNLMKAFSLPDLPSRFLSDASLLRYIHVDPYNKVLFPRVLPLELEEKTIYFPNVLVSNHAARAIWKEFGETRTKLLTRATYDSLHKADDKTSKASLKQLASICGCRTVALSSSLQGIDVLEKFSSSSYHFTQYHNAMRNYLNKPLSAGSLLYRLTHYLPQGATILRRTIGDPALPQPRFDALTISERFHIALHLVQYPEYRVFVSIYVPAKDPALNDQNFFSFRGGAGQQSFFLELCKVSDDETTHSYLLTILKRMQPDLNFHGGI